MSGDDLRDASSGKRSTSQTRPSRPTTPLRPSSRSSFRDSARSAGKDQSQFPLNAFEPAFAELSDSMADLEANMMHFQLMHESLSRFSESFASFLYGLNMNAFCVDFPEGPVPESFRRRQSQWVDSPVADRKRQEHVVDSTFVTTDTSFVENPPASIRQEARPAPPRPRQSRLPFARGTSSRARTSARGRSRPSASTRTAGSNA